MNSPANDALGLGTSNDGSSRARGDRVNVQSLPLFLPETRQRVSVTISSLSQDPSFASRNPRRLTLIQRVSSPFHSWVESLRIGQTTTAASATLNPSIVLDMPLGVTNIHSDENTVPVLFGERSSSSPVTVHDISHPQMNVSGRRLPVTDQQEVEDVGNDVALSPPSALSQIVSQNPELSVIVKAFEKYIPFLFIVGIKVFFDHAIGIFVFISLIVTFFHANSVICREIARKERRNILPLLAVLVNLSACIAFIYWAIEDQKLYMLTIFMPTNAIISFPELLWIVAINDFILKFVSVILKIVIVLMPAHVIPYRKRGNCFLLIEMSSQMHRNLIPIQVWLNYLLGGGIIGTPDDSKERRLPANVIRVVLAAAYMVVKGKLVMKDAIAWKVAVTKFWQCSRYGMSPTVDEMKMFGGLCPICHDNLLDPTILHCKHMFCEECLAIWFDREMTCPMCRAKITEDPAWRDGSTSQFVQLF